MVRKIVTRICGGLGNQMFTYAVGERLARRYGVPLAYNLIEYFSSKYVFKKGISTRTFQLRCFKGPRRYRVWPLWKALLDWGLSAVDLVVGHELRQRVLARLGIYLYRSASINFPPEIDVADGCHTMYLSSLVMSTDFMPSRDELQKEFSLAEPLDEQNAAIRERMKASESVSLHVRRTDYLTQSTPWALAPEYYRTAISLISKSVADPHWFIFSDDISWCRQIFAELSHVVFVEGNDARPWEDLELMKCCHHHILANSTFSWWGAFLSYDRNGIVVCPRKWGPDAPDKMPRTFVLDEWIQIAGVA